MKKYTNYCDICGKKITKENKLKTKILEKLRMAVFLFMLITTFRNYDGEAIDDLCNDCYVSFKKWIKSRKTKSLGG